MSEWETVSSEWETITPSRTKPIDVRGGVKSFMDASGAVADDINKREPGVDYFHGVPNAGFRADLSRMDTDQERAQFLDKRVGKLGWKKDKYGAYLLTPTGAQKFDLKTNVPVAIDEHKMTRYDIADLRGDAPAIGGAMAAGAATGGLGFMPALATMGIVTAGAKGYDEALDALRGQNIQTSGEVAKDLAKEGGLAMLGETAYRGLLRPIGRTLLAPEARHMTPQSKQALDEALSMGVRPKVGQVAPKANIVGRFETLAERIFGNPNLSRNQKAIHQYITGLKKRAGPHTASLKDVGIDVSKSIKESRRTFGNRASELYGAVDDLAGDRTIIPTASLKTKVNNLITGLPKSADGKIVLTDKQTIRSLNEILNLPDSLTVKQMQAVRGRFFDAMHSTNPVVPGVDNRMARQIYKAASSTFDDAAKLGDDEAIQALKVANRYYRVGIRKFDDHLIARIVKEPSEAGSIDPDAVVNAVFGKTGSASKISRVSRVVDPQVWSQVRHKAMDKVLSPMVDDISDPIQTIFNGKAFLKTLNTYERSQLDAMFGKEMTDDLFKLGRVVNLVSSKTHGMSGGLVTAYIALHPLKHLGTLAKMNVLSRVLSSPTGLKWFTTGLSAPKTRAGAEAVTRLTAMMTTMAEDETGPGYYTPEINNGGQ